MDRGNWKRPVVLEIFGRPGLLTVSDTLDAALVLLGVWPAKRTPTHIVAVKTCRDVLVGKAVPALARADFIDAALEAGFQVQPETFLEETEQALESGSALRTGTDGWVQHAFEGPVIAPLPAAATPPTREFRDARLPQDWHRPANSNAAPATPDYPNDMPPMRQLLHDLAITLGMIGFVSLRSTARLLHIPLQRRADRVAGS